MVIFSWDVSRNIHTLVATGLKCQIVPVGKRYWGNNLCEPVRDRDNSLDLLSKLTKNNTTEIL